MALEYNGQKVPEIDGLEYLILYHIIAPVSGPQTVKVCVGVCPAMIRAGHADTLKKIKRVCGC